MPNIVWILGAGVSTSLDGRLLRNLFTPGSQIQLEAYFPEAAKLRDNIAVHARRLYEFGKNQLLWSDAEDFLDKLAAAASIDAHDGSRLFMAELIQRTSF